MNVLLELSNNPLLEAIKPQRDDQRQFLVLLGYISATTHDTVTVYPELDLRTFLELPRADIVWAEKAVPGQESSPTKLVINAAARVNRVTNAKVEAGFLSGMIASTCLPTSAAGVTVKVSVEKDILTPASACPAPGPEQPTAKGAGGTSNCKLTGVCVSDGGLHVI